MLLVLKDALARPSCGVDANGTSLRDIKKFGV
jgi:hypothetical protein